MKRTLAALSVPVLTVVVFFVLLEIGVRIVMSNGMNFDVEMWKYATRLKTVSPNYEIAHEHVPNSSAHLMGADVEINSKKLRDKEYAYEKPAGVTRILMLGDSLTFGWGVEAQDTTSKILERELNANAPNGRRFEVINTGVGNYNTTMEVAYFFEDGRRYDPDIVILNYFINDAEETPRRHSGFMSEYSEAYVFLAGRYQVLKRQLTGRNNYLDYYSGLYADGAAGWEKAKAAITALSKYARENGIKLLIANHPELHRLDDYPFENVTRMLQAHAASLDIPFLDLLASVKGEEPETLWVTREDPHPNRKANTLFARRMKNYLTMDVSWVSQN